MDRIIKVLSIDGGGIRGIIPLTVLAEIERCSGKPISELFDFIAGTSTGGVISLGLVKPNNEGNPQFSAEKLLDLYSTQANQIFSKSIIRKIITLWGLVGSKYDINNVYKVIYDYVGDTKLSESLTSIMLTAYDIENRAPYFFKSTKAKIHDERDFRMIDAGLATASAPVYFSPVKINIPNSDEYLSLIDGGVFANNPSMNAYIEARKLYPDSEILLVSLGTGQSTKPILYDNAKNWGILKWAFAILGVVFDGISDNVDYELMKIFESANDKKFYYRFQIDLPKGSEGTDNATDENIAKLKEVGRELVANNAEMIKKLCGELNPQT